MLKLTLDRRTSLAVAFFTILTLLSALLFEEKYIRWVGGAVLLISAALTVSFVKKRCILSYHRKTVFYLTLFSSLLYLVIYYLSGLYFGFGTTLLTLSLDLVFGIVLPIAAIILLTEYVRHVLLGQENKLISLTSYTVGVISDVVIAGGVQGIDTSFKLADFFGITLLPALAANLLYNYVSKRYGKLPVLIYRAPLAFYYYLIPFIPNVPQILSAFSLLLLPILVLAFIYVLFEKKKKMAKEKRSRLAPIIVAATITICAAFILLVSCRFRYGILVIASPSMTDAINVGDAVVYEDYSYFGEIRENDVIVFSKDGENRVVHRIIEINTIDGERQYITKGDANDGPDAGYVTDGQIIGVVHFKIIYIGHPSLWLREIFE